MFTSIGSLIRAFPKRSKTPGAILALHVRQAFVDALEEACGDLPAKTIKGVKASVFKNGTLTIIAPQLVCTELSMRSGGLLRGINRALGKNIVFKLRFRSN